MRPFQISCTLSSSAGTACLFLAALLLQARTGVAEDDGHKFFRERIEPVLKSECYGCHSGEAESVKGGLRVDWREGLLKGGDSGPAVIAGKPEESLLIDALRHDGGLAMPPKKEKLDAKIIDDFVSWISRGAPDPRDALPGLTISEHSRQHWSFQPIRNPSVPQVKHVAQVRSPVDALLLAKLEDRGWNYAPPASRAEFIRRLSFDLTGLPPTPEEIDAFIADDSPEADEKLVDRLLASPHFGERSAQHWLDVVRFAESEGYEYDNPIPGAWRYRDWVIQSFNADKPFDRFVMEQIAGDEINPDDPECLSASVFHRLGPVRRNAGNPEIALSRNEVLTERTDIIGSAFLGLTVGCARCHNHKFDPILQADYYRLQAYFAATDEHNVPLASPEQQEAWNAATKTLRDEIQKLKTTAQTTSGEAKVRLKQQIADLEKQLPPPLETIPATWNVASKRTAIHVLRRGVWENKAEPVAPRPPSVLVPDSLKELPADASHPRTELAKWLVSNGQPLTARVIVNRLWQQHFGMGLVKTPNDFGLKGDRPSHPELLDWLATALVENGWRLKPIHRLIVLSRAYRQSSASQFSESGGAGERYEQDPENRLLWRFPRRRLSAEEVRDAMLSVSGQLNPRSGGASVVVPCDPELVNLLYETSQWLVTADSQEHDRRSIYLIAKRNLRLPFFEILDGPALLTSCARRETSTHAPQALELLNGDLANQLAARFARRLEAEAGGNPEQIVERAFRLALGRAPLLEEQRRAVEFLKDQPLKEFALAMFNLNGFLYVP